LQAYENLTSKTLPYTLEHGSKLMKLRTLSLLAKVAIKLANQAAAAADLTF